MSDPCIQETRITKLETGFEYFIKRTADHIHEGEKEGGARDRLFLAEQIIESLKKEISAVKQGYWKACIVSAVIGGLIARSTPDVLASVGNFLIRILSK